VKTYQHYKNGKFYEIVGNCLIQENDTWIDAVIYRRIYYTQKFCRSEAEFFEKFKLVEE
jgi:hypothetical protein